MRLALIGDIHAYQLKIHPKRLFSRRIMGHTNLWMNRRFSFNHRVLDVLFDKVRELKPDMVLLSGDVSTTSLEDEFLDIERYLRPLSEEFKLVLVPGNHDRYTFRAAKAKRIESMLKGILPNEFPHFEQLNEKWRLLALDSATPGFVFSRGALGPTQMAGARKHLSSLTPEQGVIVLCHYPVTLPAGVPSSWAHNLAEEKPLRDLLCECPARVVFMHGHVHKPWHLAPETPNEADPEVEALATAPSKVDTSTKPAKKNGRRRPKFTSINAGSPCQTSARYPLGQGFWEIKLPEHTAQRLTLTHHVPMPADNSHMALPRRERVRSLPNELVWESRVVE